jgi:hypothetical protein
MMTPEFSFSVFRLYQLLRSTTYQLVQGLLAKDTQSY